MWCGSNTPETMHYLWEKYHKITIHLIVSPKCSLIRSPEFVLQTKWSVFWKKQNTQPINHPSCAASFQQWVFWYVHLDGAIFHHTDCCNWGDPYLMAYKKSLVNWQLGSFWSPFYSNDPPGWASVFPAKTYMFITLSPNFLPHFQTL